MLQVEAGPAPDVPVAEASYETLYRENFSFVWRNVRRLGVPEASTDDAVQDVFVVLHRRLSSFEGRSAVRTWLYGIVVRVARDYRRSRNRQETKAVALAAEVETATTTTPADDTARREGARILEGLLEEIDEEKREIFVLVELEQMSVAEVAEALALNVNTAHARLRAARQQFEAAVARFRAKEKK